MKKLLLLLLLLSSPVWAANPSTLMHTSATSASVSTGLPSGTIYYLTSDGYILADPVDIWELTQVYSFLPAQINTTQGEVYNTSAATSSTTLSARSIIGGPNVILGMTGSLAGNSNLQLPTMFDLLQLRPNPNFGVAGFSINVGTTYRLRVVNFSSANTWTMTTNTSWTLSGSMVINPQTWRDFLVIWVSPVLVTLQEIAGGNVP